MQLCLTNQHKVIKVAKVARIVASRATRAKEAKASSDQVLMSAQKTTIGRGKKIGIHQ